jgi:hypothetical protein
MARKWARTNLKWDGDRLLVNGRLSGVSVVPDENYPTIMWRASRPNGSLSDMVNRTRAKDAAEVLALSILNHEETPAEAASAA